MLSLKDQAVGAMHTIMPLEIIKRAAKQQMTEHNKGISEGSAFYNPPCYHCLRYRGNARCAEYRHRIPIAYLTGSEECPKFFKRD
ncbi:MAG: hypothetical protein ACXV5F_08010 [Halobacteriota archaeon]